jgi:hypothetical protein
MLELRLVLHIYKDLRDKETHRHGEVVNITATF